MRPDTHMPFRQALPWISFVTLLFCFVYSARSILTPLLVSIETTLEIGHAQATTLLLTQSIGFSVALFISGFTLSMIRPARVMAFSVVGSGLCFLCAPLVTNLSETRWLFMAFGLCAGLYLPAALTTLASITLVRDWGKTVGIHELAPPLSFIAVPVVAQLVLDHTTWQGVLFLMGAAMTVLGTLFVFVGRGGQSTVPPTSLAGCRNLVTHWPPLALGVLFIFSMVGEFSVFSVLQLYFVDALGFTPENANHMLSLTRLVSPLAVLGGGIIADRWNIFSIIRWSLVAHALTLVLMALDFHLPALIGASLQGFTIGVLFPAVFKALVVCFSLEEQPIILSLFMPFGGLFSVGVVPFILGYCGEYATFGVGFLGLAAVSLACVMLVTPLERSIRT